MKQAVVHFEWTKSPSADVVKQTLSVKVAEAEPVVVELEATVEQWGPVTVPESAAVHVELVANDGTYDSAPAVLDFVLGDLTVPEPPTSLTYKIDEVVDVPETPAEPAPETPEPEVPAPEAPAPEAPAPEAPAPEAPVA